MEMGGIGRSSPYKARHHKKNIMHPMLSDSYRLLAASFYMPEKEVLLEENICGNLKTLMEHCCTDVQQHCLAMEQGLLESGAEELQTEYAALFVGPFELLAPPYGSIYLDGKHMLMGDSTMEVQQMYRQAGLSLTSKEVPDHIALELEFASYLTGKIEQLQHQDDISGGEELTELYDHLLHHHLGRWVPEFCRRVRIGSENGFYRSLATILEIFIEAQKSITSLPSPVQAA